jgi:hypothetical protein
VLGTLPVLLWSEQEYSLQFKVSGDVVASNEITSTKTNASRKRARDEDVKALPESLPALKRVKPNFWYAVLNTISFGLLNAAAAPLYQVPPYTPPPPPVAPPTGKAIDNSIEFIPAVEGAEVQVSRDAHSLVYMDMVKRGYLVGPGHLYGSDYNIYERGKDPSSSHSIASIRCMADAPVISGRDLISFTRVQNQVAKSAVFAFPAAPSSLNNESQEVWYVSINFRSVSHRMKKS